MGYYKVPDVEKAHFLGYVPILCELKETPR